MTFSIILLAVFLLLEIVAVWKYLKGYSVTSWRLRLYWREQLKTDLVALLLLETAIWICKFIFKISRQ